LPSCRHGNLRAGGLRLRPMDEVVRIECIRRLERLPIDKVVGDT
jgi:hypothetical protein